MSTAPRPPTGRCPTGCRSRNSPTRTGPAVSDPRRAGRRPGRGVPVTAAPVEAGPAVDAHVSTMAETEGPISAPTVAALESAWTAIRARHPEVPAAVIVLGAGSIGAAGRLKLGHFAAMRWADPDQPAAKDGAGGGLRLPEVFVGGEGLVRGLAAVLGTLLHEAAHALAHVRGSRTPLGRPVAQREVQGACRGARDRGRQRCADRVVPDHHPRRHPLRLRGGDIAGYTRSGRSGETADPAGAGARGRVRVDRSDLHRPMMEPVTSPV